MINKYSLALLCSVSAFTAHADFETIKHDVSEKASQFSEKARELSGKALKHTKEFFKKAQKFTSETIKTTLGKIDNINSVDENGNNILMSLLILTNAPDEESLASITHNCIERGINLKIKNNDGFTALDLAKNNEHEQAAHLIEQALIEKGLNS